MILNEYTLKKKLGKGAYGEVHLADNRNGNQFALKSIGLQGLKNQPFLLDYLEGQIECMKTMNSKYIMKLYATYEDQNNKYLVCQYCQGGDLFNYQAKFPGKVFSLDDATRVLADVIKGLQDLHSAGYLHRDIKSQNILIKNQNGKQYFKLADFGFSKKSSQVEGTVLGTEYYMSPQIYRSQRYGFEIDMWAFGVLFYFMLNLEFPFKINPRSSPEKKEIQLVKASTNFSYQRSVKDSKKQLTKNCTPETEDLFKRIFNPIVDERITFLQLRHHPLFAKHFPEVSHISKKIYTQKYDDSKILKKRAIQNPQKDQENVRLACSIIKKKDEIFPKEKLLLETQKDSIDFLRQNQEQISYSNYFQACEKLSLSFNLTKFYIILLKDFIQSLKNPQILLKKYNNLKWKQFSKTKAFKNILTQAQQDLNKAEIKFNLVYFQCSNYLNQINTINLKFKAAFQKQISEKELQGAFKQSYRNSTQISFNNLRNLMKNDNKGNKMNYYLAIVVISHVFNHIFKKSENNQGIFQDYFKQTNRSFETIDYSELRQWMTKATVGQLNTVTKNIIKVYF